MSQIDPVLLAKLYPNVVRCNRELLHETLSHYTTDEEGHTYYDKGTHKERYIGYFPKDTYLEQCKPIEDKLLVLKQSRKHSLFEAVLNMLSGAILSFGITELLASSLDITIHPLSNLKLTIILTVVSITRSYLWRRYFNGK